MTPLLNSVADTSSDTAAAFLSSAGVAGVLDIGDVAGWLSCFLVSLVATALARSGGVAGALPGALPDVGAASCDTLLVIDGGVLGDLEGLA